MLYFQQNVPVTLAAPLTISAEEGCLHMEATTMTILVL